MQKLLMKTATSLVRVRGEIQRYNFVLYKETEAKDVPKVPEMYSTNFWSTLTHQKGQFLGNGNL